MNLTLSKLKLVFLFMALNLIYEHRAEFINSFRYDLLFFSTKDCFKGFDNELNNLIESFAEEHPIFTAKRIKINF